MGCGISPRVLAGVGGQKVEKACQRWVRRVIVNSRKLGIAQGRWGLHKEARGNALELSDCKCDCCVNACSGCKSEKRCWVQAAAIGFVRTAGSWREEEGAMRGRESRFYADVCRGVSGEVDSE